MALPAECSLALKEWAVTQEALDRGLQVVLLRKGGIREEDREFRLKGTMFLIYPTYEHQRRELVKPPFHPLLDEVLARPRSPDRVVFTHFAVVEEAVSVTEQERVSALSPCYIWTEDYAQARLRWRPRRPLWVMLVRAYRLERPVEVPYRPEFGGCRSWVDLPEPVALGRLTPVITDDEFQRKAREARRALGLVSAEG